MCTGMVWDDVRSLWVVTLQNTESGEIFQREAAVVISAIGTLDRPAVPNIEGRDLFRGEMFHSAEWKDGFDPKNKRITVIGNGASATQFVPELVKSVGSNGKVIQHVRSSHWWTKRVSLLVQFSIRVISANVNRGILGTPKLFNPC